MQYKEIKNWLDLHKPKLVLGTAFILVFFCGFGVGRYEKNRRTNTQIQNNYSTNQAKPQNQEKTDQSEAAKVMGAKTDTESLNQASSSAATISQKAGECIIKGNLSSSGKKIYHIPGGAFYKTVKPEMCFSTESEALAAGFIKSGR